MNFSVTNEYKKTILHRAAKAGDVKLIEYVLNQLNGRALLNVKDNDGNTAIMVAVIFNQLEVIKYFYLDVDIDVTIVNKEGKTILHLAAEKKMNGLIKNISKFEGFKNIL